MVQVREEIAGDPVKPEEIVESPRRVANEIGRQQLKLE
jgi:hypothetical protein